MLQYRPLRRVQQLNNKNDMFKWIDDKHRLVVINDETFQEEKSFRLHPVNVFGWVSVTLIVVVSLTLLFLVFTPLGRIVPERSNQHIRAELNTIFIKVDSLEEAVFARDLYITKIRNLVYEEFEYAEDVEDPSTKQVGVDVAMPSKSNELKELIERVDNETELGNLLDNTLLASSDIEDIVFVPPVTGMVSDTFAPNREHFGTDVVAPRGKHIKAIQKGTVVMATFSVETGHMLAVQHSNDILSFYKHNSANLKKPGDVVRAGEVIAIIGNSGEMTDGPHLHFEMWIKGQPINPERYIQFRN
jgi:murein DD-endopeptidase MepM/ murein hydrolase activator NlpD